MEEVAIRSIFSLTSISFCLIFEARTADDFSLCHQVANFLNALLPVMQVYEFVGLSELYYAGSHGMDIVSPANGSAVLNGHPNCVKLTDNQVFFHKS